MGHNITAIITQPPFKDEVARKYDLPVIFLPQDFVLIGLEAAHSDHWTEELGLDYGENTDIILDCPVTHHFAREMRLSRYAIIHTDYFGGIGTQFAVVYEQGKVIMETREGGINAALRRMGVWKMGDLDEFDSIHLGDHRSLYHFFEKYEY